MRSVPEGTGIEFRALFYDAANSPAIPATAHWRLDCDTTGRVLQNVTEVPVVYSTDEFGGIIDAHVDVLIDASLNDIQSEANRHEVKQLTVFADYNTPRQCPATISYDVKNWRRR